MQTLIISISVFVLLTACSTQQARRNPPPAAVAGSNEYPTAIIDAHTHPSFDGETDKTSGITNAREKFVEELRAANVVGAVAMQGPSGKDYPAELEKMNVIRCYGVGKTVEVARLEKGLKSGAYKCIKIYLGYVHQYASSPNYQPAYRLAEKYDVPVVFHSGDTYDMDAKLKYADPLTIDEVAVDHRKIKFVIAHLGNPWTQSAAEVAYKNPNVFLEASAFLIGDLSKKPPAAVKKLMVEQISWVFDYVEDPSKVMFGTDWPLVNIRSYAQVFKDAIPREHWQAVFHDNAARIYKFDQANKK